MALKIKQSLDSLDLEQMFENFNPEQDSLGKEEGIERNWEGFDSLSMIFNQIIFARTSSETLLALHPPS